MVRDNLKLSEFVGGSVVAIGQRCCLQESGVNWWKNSGVFQLICAFTNLSQTTKKRDVYLHGMFFLTSNL